MLLWSKLHFFGTRCCKREEIELRYDKIFVAIRAFFCPTKRCAKTFDFLGLQCFRFFEKDFHVKTSLHQNSTVPFCFYSHPKANVLGPICFWHVFTCWKQGHMNQKYLLYFKVILAQMYSKRRTRFFLPEESFRFFWRQTHCE